LNLQKGRNYFLDGEQLKEDSIVSIGDNFIKFKGRLLSEKLEFEGIQFECYVIYTSLWLLIRIEKLDLVGLDRDKEYWTKHQSFGCRLENQIK
jgi:hypothetical protein